MRVYRTKTSKGRSLNGWVRADIGLIVICSTVLAAGLALTAEGIDAIGSGSAELQAEPEIQSVPAVAETDGSAEPSAASLPCATFNERFYPDEPSASFDERFASAFGSSEHATYKVAAVAEHDDDAQQPDSRERAPDEPAFTPVPMTPAPARAPMTPIPPRKPAVAREGRLKTAEASLGLSSPLDSDSRTAIYDIAARTVYLPDGTRLEAHSGLGSRLDDPRFIRTKMQGPTPPNVYKLALREQLFHGVRAIRLLPVDDGKMFGRDGILAHSYMLGPSGQSNGCVSFRNYAAFLNAFLKGDVNRLVVVDHLATTTGAKVSSASGG